MFIIKNFIKSPRLWATVLILITGSLTVDALSTFHAASKYGTGGENNPIVRYFMNQFGIGSGLIINRIIAVPTIMLGLAIAVWLTSKFFEKEGSITVHRTLVGVATLVIVSVNLLVARGNFAL